MVLLERICRELEERVDFSKGERWVLGFSGGPDSVFLLETLMKFREQRGIKLDIVLVHINHLLRGEDSEEDENFCRKIAEKYSLKLFVKRIDIEKISSENKIGLEEAGREERHHFFRKIMEEEKCDRIALAHNKDDQIETFLFRLIRGTGLEGLEGIAYLKPPYIRPIVGIYKNEIMDFLDIEGIPYRIDKSNLENDFTRNSIRLDLIPFIEERYNPKFKDKIYNLIGDIRETNKEIFKDFNDFLADIDKLSINRLKTLSDLSKKRVIADFIFEKGYSCDRYKLDKIIELLKRGGTKKLSLSGETFLIKDYEHIYIEKKSQKNKGNSRFDLKREIELKIPGKTVFGDYEIEAVIGENTSIKCHESNSILTNLKKGDTLKIRCRRDGDRMVPIGLNSEKKLKDIFINEKIPKEMREVIPIFTFKEEIFWVGGIKVNEKYLKKKGDIQWTELILRRRKSC